MYRRELNKYIKQNCASSWIYLRDYTGIHGQQKIKNEASLINTAHFNNHKITQYIFEVCL